MVRPSFATLYMNFAVGLSARSTCSRASVGCVITSVDHRYVYGVGYNGGATGLANECASSEPGNCEHLHAEENAIINNTTQRYVQKFVYATTLPCSMCAKRLINMGGVKKVFYLNDYRLKTALNLFQQAGIEYEHFMPNDLEG